MDKFIERLLVTLVYAIIALGLIAIAIFIITTIMGLLRG